MNENIQRRKKSNQIIKWGIVAVFVILFFGAYFDAFKFTIENKGLHLLGWATLLWVLAWLFWPALLNKLQAAGEDGDQAEVSAAKEAELQGKQTAVKAVLSISGFLLLGCYLAYYMAQSPEDFLGAVSFEKVAVATLALMTVFWAAWRTRVATQQADARVKKNALTEKKFQVPQAIFVESTDMTKLLTEAAQLLDDSNENKQKNAVVLLKQIGLSNHEFLANSALLLLEEKLNGQEVPKAIAGDKTSALGQCYNAIEAIKAKRKATPDSEINGLKSNKPNDKLNGGTNDELDGQLSLNGL